MAFNQAKSMSAMKQDIEAWIQPNLLNSTKKICVVCLEDATQTYCFCACGVSIYCSKECEKRDEKFHAACCLEIRTLWGSVDEKATSLIGNIPGGLRVSSLFGKDFIKPYHFNPRWRYEQLETDVGTYLVARRLLINALLREGCRRIHCPSLWYRRRDRNEYAFDLAIMHCHHLLILGRLDTYHNQVADFRCNVQECLMNICLYTGRLDELYDLSCYFLRNNKCSNGEVLDDYEIHRHYEFFKKGRQSHLNIAISHLEGALQGRKELSRINWNAMIHIFLAKCLMHFKYASLMDINSKYLDNSDCLNRIGEFLGLKAKHLTFQKNHYLNQALEVMQHFYCRERYQGGNFIKQFENVRLFGEEFLFSMGLESKLVDRAIAIGTKWIHDREEKRKAMVLNEKWEDMIKCLEEDRSIICNTYILPSLDCPIRYLNNVSGYNAIGLGVGPTCCLTKFFTDALKICRGAFGGSGEDEFLCYMMYGQCSHYLPDPEENGVHEHSSLWEYDGNCALVEALYYCMMLERKMAQFHFYLNRGNADAAALLKQLSSDIGKAEQAQQIEKSNDDLEQSQEATTDVLGFDKLLPYESWMDLHPFLATALPDLADVVKALFKANFASEENLALLFGKGGYVSSQLWALKVDKEDADENRRESVVPFLCLRWTWTEGCTVYEPKSRLNLHYLTKKERREQFAKVDKATRQRCLDELYPSLREFIDTFGWSRLGIKSDPTLFHESRSKAGACVKRRILEVPDFDSPEEACGFFFDTPSLEEAMFDHSGIPWVVALNGDEKVMQQSNWSSISMQFPQPNARTYVEYRLDSGSAVLGRRIAQALDGKWWKEPTSSLDRDNWHY